MSDPRHDDLSQDDTDAQPELEALRSATARLVRTVDGIGDAGWRAPSLLPGWSRAHVVAHLALNAEGLEGAVRGLLERQPVAMYASQEDRDRDIDLLATASPTVLRDRLLGAAAELAEALSAFATVLPDLPELADAVIERTPGSGRTFPAVQVPLMRRREVEVHHADLGLDYNHDAWPEDFVRLLLDGSAARHDGAPFLAYAVDLDETWTFGHPGAGPEADPDGLVTVSGPSPTLAWWSTGRPLRAGQEGALTTDGGRELPRIEEM
jgi:maleylpyruvate isomerase